MLTMTSFCSYVSCLDSLKEKVRLTLDVSGKCPGVCRPCSDICQGPGIILFPRVLTHGTVTAVSPLLLLLVLTSVVSPTMCSTGYQSSFPFCFDCFLGVSSWFAWADWAPRGNWYVNSWVPEEEVNSRYLDYKEMGPRIPGALCFSG